jgi:hypothetical protein
LENCDHALFHRGSFSLIAFGSSSMHLHANPKLHGLGVMRQCSQVARWSMALPSEIVPAIEDTIRAHFAKPIAAE